ncbi:MAG: DUF2442 domain-containing protein [Rhodocyclaceae bacterium]|nr:DUF2442 domain-containing protein [Rhodocyclaceae bacterium]
MSVFHAKPTMLLEITHAKYLSNYQMQMSFNDGRSGVADLHPLISSNPQSVFGVFADEAFVHQFSLQHGTLCWPEERDIAAEYLYFLTFHDTPSLQPLFKQWGYLNPTEEIP